MYTKLLYYLFVMDYIYTKLQNQHHTWGNIQTEYQQNFSLLTAPSVHLEHISALKPNNLISIPPDMRENRVIYSKRLNGYCRWPLGWASKLSASIQKQRLHFVLWSNPRSTHVALLPDLGPRVENCPSDFFSPSHIASEEEPFISRYPWVMAATHMTYDLQHSSCTPAPLPLRCPMAIWWKLHVLWPQGRGKESHMVKKGLYNVVLSMYVSTDLQYWVKRIVSWNLTEYDHDCASHGCASHRKWQIVN